LLAEIATAERAAAEHPDDTEAWGRLASALRRANRLQEAARAAWRAVELAPSVESWTSLGNVLMQGGAPTGAMAAFEEVSRQTSDGFLAAQNFLNLGYRAWLWGMDDLAMRAYARADELAPGHPLVLYDRTLLLAASGKVATAQAEATKLRNVVDRVLQDRPPLEMVEILEPMKALTESVMNGDAVARLPPQPEAGQRLPDRFWRRDPGQSHALDLAVDETSERYYPIAGWQVLALNLPSGWTDNLEVAKGQPTSAQIRLEAAVPRPVLWLLTITESRQAPDLDRLIVEAQRKLSGTTTLGEVHSFTGRGMEGRTFVADDPGMRPEDRSGFPRVCVAVLRAKGFLVIAKRFLRDRDPGQLDESERILRALEVRDLTPPHR
jgi:tetratricopeptide (TPR) repeat protein